MATPKLNEPIQEAIKLADTLNKYGMPHTGVYDVDNALGGLSIVVYEDDDHYVGVFWNVEMGGEEARPMWRHYVNVRRDYD